MPRILCMFLLITTSLYAVESSRMGPLEWAQKLEAEARKLGAEGRVADALDKCKEAQACLKDIYQTRIFEMTQVSMLASEQTNKSWGSVPTMWQKNRFALVLHAGVLKLIFMNSGGPLRRFDPFPEGFQPWFLIKSASDEDSSHHQPGHEDPSESYYSVAQGPGALMVFRGDWGALKKIPLPMPEGTKEMLAPERPFFAFGPGAKRAITVQALARSDGTRATCVFEVDLKRQESQRIAVVEGQCFPAIAGDRLWMLEGHAPDPSATIAGLRILASFALEPTLTAIPDEHFVEGRTGIDAWWTPRSHRPPLARQVVDGQVRIKLRENEPWFCAESLVESDSLVIARGGQEKVLLWDRRSGKSEVRQSKPNLLGMLGSNPCVLDESLIAFGPQVNPALGKIEGDLQVLQAQLQQSAGKKRTNDAWNALLKTHGDHPEALMTRFNFASKTNDTGYTLRSAEQLWIQSRSATATVYAASAAACLKKAGLEPITARPSGRYIDGLPSSCESLLLLNPQQVLIPGPLAICGPLEERRLDNTPAKMLFALSHRQVVVVGLRDPDGKTRLLLVKPDGSPFQLANALLSTGEELRPGAIILGDCAYIPVENQGKPSVLCVDFSRKQVKARSLPLTTLGSWGEGLVAAGDRLIALGSGISLGLDPVLGKVVWERPGLALSQVQFGVGKILALRLPESEPVFLNPRDGSSTTVKLPQRSPVVLHSVGDDRHAIMTATKADCTWSMACVSLTDGTLQWQKASLPPFPDFYGKIPTSWRPTAPLQFFLHDTTLYFQDSVAAKSGRLLQLGLRDGKLQGVLTLPRVNIVNKGGVWNLLPWLHPEGRGTSLFHIGPEGLSLATAQGDGGFCVLRMKAASDLLTLCPSINCPGWGDGTITPEAPQKTGGADNF